jgi:hypothetical protein
MRINTRLRTIVVGIGMAAVVGTFAMPAAVAMEPEYPAPTAESLKGEWAGYWRGKPLGFIVLFTLNLDAKLRGTIVRNTGSAVAAVYDIDEAVVSSGVVSIRAHDRERPKIEAVLEAKGGVWETDGWLDATFTDRRTDSLVFQVRLEKAPENLARKLHRMLSAARKAERTPK